MQEIKAHNLFLPVVYFKLVVFKIYYIEKMKNLFPKLQTRSSKWKNKTPLPNDTQAHNTYPFPHMLCFNTSTNFEWQQNFRFLYYLVLSQKCRKWHLFLIDRLIDCRLIDWYMFMLVCRPWKARVFIKFIECHLWLRSVQCLSSSCELCK